MRDKEEMMRQSKMKKSREMRVIMKIMMKMMMKTIMKMEMLMEMKMKKS